MVNLFVTFFFLLGPKADTVYLNNNLSISSKENYSFYRIKQTAESDSNVVVEITYLKSGQKIEEIFYSDYASRSVDGFYREWFDNGAPKSESQFSKGILHGKRISYWPSGQVKRREYYDEGKFAKGSCYTQTGLDTTYFEIEQMPEFPTGIEGWMDFLSKNTHYPRNDQENGITGKVFVSFTVGYNGEILDSKVIRGISEGCNREALKAINKMPLWKPGYSNGFKAKIKYSLPINFQKARG